MPRCFQCRCTEKTYRDYVTSTQVPLLVVSDAWRSISRNFQVGNLADCVLKSARDSCFILRFSPGTFQAFSQALQTKGASAKWKLSMHGFSDSYTMRSEIEVVDKWSVLARFTMTCDVCNSYIQPKLACDFPMPYDHFVGEFADKRLGAPALILWSPRAAVFQAVLNPRSVLQTPIKRIESPGSSPSRASVSKGVLILTPKLQQVSTPTPQSSVKQTETTTYTYTYVLCTRPNSISVEADSDDILSTAGKEETDEVTPPAFPVSCRAMLDEYSYYAQEYCVSSAYMFSSVHMLPSIVSEAILDDISSHLEPLVEAAEDFELSFTSSSDSHSLVEDNDVVSSSADDIDDNDTATEPLLKFGGTEQQEGISATNAPSTSEKDSKQTAIDTAANPILTRIARKTASIVGSNGASCTESDTEELIAFDRDTSQSQPVGINNTRSIQTTRYIRNMPLHYPTLAVPCPDAKPHTYGDHLLKPAISKDSTLSSPKTDISAPKSSRCYKYANIEELIRHLCGMLATSQ